MIEIVKDPHTLLLLHGEDFVDSSMYGRGITNSGASLDTANKKFGASSLYFNGSTRLNLNDNSYLNFGTGDFTIDWWEYLAANISGGCVFALAGATQGEFIHYYTNGNIQLWFGAQHQGTVIGTYALNTWTHRAFVRSGNTLYYYQNGTLVWSGAFTGNVPYVTGCQASIGGRSNMNQYFIGSIDEFRISNVARWTTDFTPPTSPYADLSITITQGGVVPKKHALRRRMMISGGGLALPPVGTPLADWTWEQIVALSNSGTDPRNYFSVGDEKDLILTTGEVVPTVIGDFYHNTITGTNIKAPIAFTFKNCLSTTYKMNDSWTNAGGWDGSKMRTTHMVNIFNTFPAELRADGAVKYVDVATTAGSQSTSLVISSDRLRLHSITELGLTYLYAGTEGTTYAYYSSGNRVKTVNGTANWYWPRSPYTANTGAFCTVGVSGAAGAYNADSAGGVACGFDI